MEDSLTTAEKVRRQLKAGRKRKTVTLPSMFDAVQRLCAEADRARSLMQKNGLNPDDIKLAIVYRVADAAIRSSPLPAPGNIGAFITKLENIAAQARVDFLGIIWQQTDRDAGAKHKAVAPTWVTEFADDKRAALELLLFKNKLAAMSAPNAAQKGDTSC